MAPINHFTDLVAWKVNYQGVLEIYKITRSFPHNERYNIVDQFRRAAISITNNIAEGWGVFHFSNKIRYYYIARGSNCEIQNLLITSRDLGFVSKQEYDRINKIVFDGFKILNGLIRSVEKSKNDNK